MHNRISPAIPRMRRAAGDTAPARPRRRRWLALAAGLAIAAGPLVAFAPAAFAGTGTPCRPVSCNNLDPTQSYNIYTGVECDNPASTVGNTTAFGGYLELRWGPNCIVNWTRFAPAHSGTYKITTTRLSDGVTTTYQFSGAPGVSYYDNEVYAPDAAQACVTELSGGKWLPRVCYTQ
jgi:hypothetical protein